MHSLICISPEPLFSPISQIFLSCVFIFILLKIKKKKKLKLWLWPLCYLEICCLIYLGIFWALFILLAFTYTVVCVHTLYDFNFFWLVKVCSMVHNVVCLGECSMRTSEECAFCCCWMKESMDVNYTQLVMVLLSSTVSFLILWWLEFIPFILVNFVRNCWTLFQNSCTIFISPSV